MDKALKVLEFIGNVVVPWLFNYWNKKKAEKLGKVVTVLTEGIEVAEEIKKAKQDESLTQLERVKLVKNVVKEFAKDSGVQDYLDKKVQPFKNKFKSGIENKVNKVLEKIIN